MNHKIFIKNTLILAVLFIILDFLISAFLLNGLNKFYGINRKPDILINGSSMAMSGFNRTTLELVTNRKIASYSHEGVSVIDRFAMIDHFFQKYPKSETTVIYELNPLILSDINSAENVYTIFYPYLDDSYINRYVKERADDKDYYIKKIIRTRRFDSRLIRLIFRGYLGKYENLKTNSLDLLTLNQNNTLTGKVDVFMQESNIKIFENTMHLIRSNNSNIILVMMPMYFMKLQSFNSEGYRNLCNYFENYCLTREYIEFLDLNKDSIIYKAEYFSDPLHFNVNGQQYITSVISSYLIEN